MPDTLDANTAAGAVAAAPEVPTSNKFRPERVMLTDSRLRALEPASPGKRYSL
jgi:hypothetical protein